MGSSVVNVEMLGEAVGVIITQQLVVGVVLVFRSVVAPIPILLLHLGWLVDIKPTRSFPTMPFLKETPSFLQYLPNKIIDNDQEASPQQVLLSFLPHPTIKIET